MEPTNSYQPPLADASTPSASRVDLTRPFDPSGRFGRLSYIAWAILANFAVNIVQFVIAMAFGITAAGAGMTGGGGILYTAISLLLTIAVVFATVVFFIRRLHDMDLSGWWALLMLVPLVNVAFGLYCILKPGTDGPNRFGPSRPTPDWEKVVGIVGAVLIGMSLLVLLIALIAATLNPELMEQLKQVLSEA